MSGWQASVSGYSVDNNQQYEFDFNQPDNNFYNGEMQYYGEDQSQFASSLDPPPGAIPPPPKAARSDYDQASYGGIDSFAGSSGFADPRVNNVGGMGPLPSHSGPSGAGPIDPYAEGQITYYPQSVSQSVGGSSYQQQYQQQQPQQQQQSSYSMREDWAECPDYTNANVDYYPRQQSQQQGFGVDSYDAHQPQHDWSNMAHIDAVESASSSGLNMPRPTPLMSSGVYGMSGGLDEQSASFTGGLDQYRNYDSTSQGCYDSGGWSHSHEAFSSGGIGGGISGGGDLSRKRMASPTASSSSSFFSRHQSEYQQQYQAQSQPPSLLNESVSAGCGPRNMPSMRFNPPILPGGTRTPEEVRRSNNGSMMQPSLYSGDFNSARQNRAGGAPLNRIMRPVGGLNRHGGMGLGGGPLNAIRGGPANFISGSRRGGRGLGGGGPVSLMDATFAPPAGLPMQVKREKSIARWARAVRQEWPLHERRVREAATEEGGGGRRDSLQVTSFLSDVLQRELRKNMTFLYGSLRDVAFGDRGGRGEFYPRDASETTVLVDLCYDDVFVAQGHGGQRFEARENASQKALDMFLRDRVYVVGCYRLWEGEQIPGFCVNNSRCSPDRLPPYPRNPKRERGITEKPDSKTLPWLQVNPSSKMDTSSRLKPKSMKDFFILINGRGDDYSESEEKFYKFSAGFPKSLNAVAVVNNSAQFNQMKVEYRVSTKSSLDTGDGEQQQMTHHCTILMDQQEVGEGEGADAGLARRSACENVLGRLSMTQPVVRMQLDRAETVSRNELDGWAKKLADQELEWVKEMDSKLDPANPMKEPHLQRIMDDAEAYLKQYIHDERQEPLKFGAEFTHDERMAIHKAARRLGLASKPYGPQWRLYQVVSLRFSLVELKRILLERGVAGRYALVEGGSADMKHLWETEKEEGEEEEKKKANEEKEKEVEKSEVKVEKSEENEVDKSEEADDKEVKDAGQAESDACEEIKS